MSLDEATKKNLTYSRADDARLRNDHDVMSGVKLPPKAVENAKTQKEDFSDDELTRLFVALGAFRTHREPVMREWYWGVLMVAHSGCRAQRLFNSYGLT